MKNNRFIKNILPLLLVAAGIIYSLAGCDDFLEEKNVPGITADFYNTRQGVNAALDATYAYLRTGVGAEITNLLTELGTDLTSGATGAMSYPTNQYNASLNASLSNFSALWNNHYKAINVTNLVLASLPDVTDVTANERTQFTAEMSFLRAYFFFDLVQQFGRIPLKVEVDDAPRTDYKRETVANVYNQIIADLTTACNGMSETPSLTGKATRYSAAHLLSKVYLTRASAVTEDRGQKSTDADSALFYAEQVINSGKYTLVSDYAALWSITNQGNSEVVFSVQFTSDMVYNGAGNLAHLYWTSMYESLPGLVRDIEGGRPYRFHRATNKTLFELYDRKNDARFYKMFKWVYYCNRATATLAVGDTALYYSLNPPKAGVTYRYTYKQWDRENPNNNNDYYPTIIKYFDPTRLTMNETKSSREWVRMRLGETCLLAAEAAGRAGNFDKAAFYVNELRKRAAWKEGETKMPQYWV
ncbi:MAG: RagB/SusD family nutrient uptake outer membrane protein, partial [Tannerella sp.]|nr:RagB/SusD family nutrient uptake outer membrane protein [Tannerella sp.]